MIGISNAVPIFIFIKSIGAGFLIGAVFELTSLIRALGRKSVPTVVFADLLFFFLSALITFLFLLWLNVGIPRAYVFFGEAFGATVFMKTLGRIRRARRFEKKK